MIDFFPDARLQSKKIVGWNFDHSFSRLPGDFYTLIQPSAVKIPHLVLFNEELAIKLGLKVSEGEGELIPEVFGGNVLPEGSLPLSQAYAGHQFGHFTMLGDGRAVLLGEQICPDGNRVEVQLKGSGRTPYSRGGDGRATLKSMLREYLISEAIHYLGIPGSRSLAVVFTSEGVPRERLHPGGVLTRVASSHLRVGTFEYARKFLTIANLKKLLHYAIERHYPHLVESDQPALDLLREVMLAQIDLVVDWMRVGFIHGVLNTDNISLAGETIDYGPCAFMNAYDPSTVFSSIDSGGRYAFGNQPAIMQWNIGIFAGALLPLVHENIEIAKKLAMDVIEQFTDRYEARLLCEMRKKLGLVEERTGDAELVEGLLLWMKSTGEDFTNTFLALRNGNCPEGMQGSPQWYHRWKKRISTNENPNGAFELMGKSNPVYIPRNHLVENALDNAGLKGDFSLFMELLEVIKKPYENQQKDKKFTSVPKGFDSSYQTFCGT